ncbi:MAG: homospermidine synthase [Chloroflexi bacterium]|nr:homospermidine synthase [Chloroflexota bacterium]NOG34682.1 homospermidine synthase [Chloroflexota bacterium]GIK57744.1 MAG: homospermidine synthase [Chloroflexota bacterium]
MKIEFNGRILILGCGSVSRCFQPLLLRHFDMDFQRVTILDLADLRQLIPDTLAAGVPYVQAQITPDNLAQLLGQYVGPGDLLVDLAWNIDCGEIVQWCHDHHVLYINTSVELWDPYEDAANIPPVDRTLYVRHLALRERVKGWTEKGVTAVVEHGANPGLVSHWVKVALTDIATEMLRRGLGERAALERALSDRQFAQLAMLSRVKVIHISERDTQIGNQPKEVNEFVNTWSVEGFREEGVAPAEMGWGTHERRLPPGAHTHSYGPGNQICLAQMGINTWVRSWVPRHGEILGMVVRHGEAFTISDHLTVWDGPKPLYRPTVHYAYLPTDAAIASLHELKMRNFAMQEKQRIMTDEIISGMDELGVLLLGHALNGWWVGSQLDIEETRRLVPHQNATTLQVAASVLGAVAWMIRHPNEGVNVPDDLPHEDVLAVANPYLGPSPSVQTDWTPLKNRVDLYARYGRARPADEDVWQFETFLA